MGGGSWTSESYDAYTRTTRGVDAATYSTMSVKNVQEVYRSRRLHKELNPLNVMRECCDSEEHPNTIPVILALDVTGSMGKAATEVAQKLGEIMADIYNSKIVPDVEFCVMAIGDLYCDSAPIQISQFESDIRIAEQLDNIFFEGGGGGNDWESYTAAWYMGLHHCKLDCWQRGKRGIIITLGDEQLNPYLQKVILHEKVGDSLQGHVETDQLYKDASQKFDIHHISVDDFHSSYRRNNDCDMVDLSWRRYLGQNYHISTIGSLSKTITDIITESSKSTDTSAIVTADGISW